MFAVSCFAQENDRQLQKKRKKFLKKHTGWAYIPEGSFQWPDDTIKSGDFFMLKTEVTNIMWQEYLYYKADKNGDEMSTKLGPDTSLWASTLPNFAPYATHYHKHPAYHHYPAVNISYEQAEAYCAWLESFLNNVKDKNYKSVKVRLPNNNEWMYAAAGGNAFPIYPWPSLELVDRKGRDLANYYKVLQALISYDSSANGLSLIVRQLGTNDYDWIDLESPSYAESYPPNAYGLYGMAGNVAEFVSDLQTTEGDHPKRIVKGGSWADPAHFLQIANHRSYKLGESASPMRGFRPILEIEF
jgi:sulfatase modifying factor 1